MKYCAIICLACSALVSNVIAMSKQEKVLAIAKIWQDQKNLNIKNNISMEKALWSCSNYNWDIEVLYVWNNELGALRSTGIILNKLIPFNMSEKIGYIEDFNTTFGARLIKNYECFRNNKYFTLLPVLMEKNAHVFLFRFPLKKEDPVLTFIADLGEFQDLKQCDISYDSSCIRIEAGDNISLISIKMPKELIFKPKKIKLIM